MQLKLKHIILSVTDEISMVGFTPFQQMNETICQIKGTSDGNWGNICANSFLPVFLFRRVQSVRWFGERL